MIISHKYKFIFIKTLKTAGTSIEVFLSQQCGLSDVLTPIDPHVEPHVARNYNGYFNHIGAHVIRDKIGANMWNSYFKFCCERNPWDKTISKYYFLKSLEENKSISFDEYLAGSRLPINFPQYTEPADPNKILVNRIVYYETLLRDLGKIFSELGIPFNGTLGVNAKSKYRIDRRPYIEVYTPDQAMRIAEIFRQEILLHGYEFLHPFGPLHPIIPSGVQGENT